MIDNRPARRQQRLRLTVGLLLRPTNCWRPCGERMRMRTWCRQLGELSSAASYATAREDSTHEQLHILAAHVDIRPTVRGTFSGRDDNELGWHA
jgi:hypothetical protein